MTAVEPILQLALRQQGKPYRFGAQPSASDPDPRAFDCSSFVRWCCDRNGVTPAIEWVTYYQHIQCIQRGTIVGIEQGIATRGALLFNHRDLAGNPKTPSNPVDPATFGHAHVAFSLGDGSTIEAMSTGHGVLVGWTAERGWTAAARIPGVSYGPDPGDGFPAPRRDKPYLTYGARGPAVVEMQQLLIATGLVPQLAAAGATGNFLTITLSSVRTFQSDVRARTGDGRMVVDGECGPVTWAWLYRANGQ